MRGLSADGAQPVTRHEGLRRQRLEAYQFETGKLGTPSQLIDDLTAALTRAIEELTRPIDAIKHQAKTVTVGISRNDEGVLDRDLVQAVLNAGVGRDRLSYKTLKVLADLDPAVADVVGFTRYGIEGEPDSGEATIAVIDRGGLSRDVPSRVERNPMLGPIFMNSLPMELAEPRDVSNVVLFLASEESRYVTGLEFTVDAGNTIR